MPQWSLFQKRILFLINLLGLKILKSLVYYMGLIKTASLYPTTLLIELMLFN